MSTNPTKHMIRLTPPVSEGLGRLADAAAMQTSDYIVDVLARHCIENKAPPPEEAVQIEAEIELKEEARQVARRTCADTFDEHVILKVFQAFRTDDRLRKIYETAIGGDPFARGNPAQARINRTLGILIRNAIDGEAMNTENGDKLNVQVSREFIKSYSPLKLATST